MPQYFLGFRFLESEPSWTPENAEFRYESDVDSGVSSYSLLDEKALSGRLDDGDLVDVGLSEEEYITALNLLGPLEFTVTVNQIPIGLNGKQLSSTTLSEETIVVDWQEFYGDYPRAFSNGDNKADDFDVVVPLYGEQGTYENILYEIKISGNYTLYEDSTGLIYKEKAYINVVNDKALESQIFGGLDFPPDDSLTNYLTNVLVDLDSGSTIESSTSYKLKSGEENLILTGFDDINGTGNGLDNIITGNDYNNIINGKGGGDSMVGLDGDDIYYVNNANDKVVEFEDQGVDTVRASINERLSANVENLKLLGSNAINATGNGLDNAITGNNAKNVIDGKGGADEMAGKNGDDIYTVNNKNDTVIEVSDQGTDTVRSSIGYTLENNVENLILITGKAINGTGNNLNNRIKGNNNRNNLKGKAGIDTLTGGLEKDTLTGGGDADKFIYNSTNDSGTTGATRDVITDFSDIDKINLAKIDADQGMSGNQEFVFIGSDSFTGAGQVRFSDGLLSVNTDDDAQANMQIKLLGVTTFDETSLIL